MRPRTPVVFAAIAAVSSLALSPAAFAQASFDEGVFLPAGTMPEAVAIGDLDGDGWNDLAVVNFGGDLHVLVGAIQIGR